MDNLKKESRRVFCWTDASLPRLYVYRQTSGWPRLGVRSTSSKTRKVKKEKKKMLSSFSVGAGRSSEVERSLMVRWVVGSILHGVDPLSYFSFQPVLHDWCNKGRGMCYPVCGMVHIK